MLLLLLLLLQQLLLVWRMMLVLLLNHPLPLRKYVRLPVVIHGATYQWGCRLYGNAFREPSVGYPSHGKCYREIAGIFLMMLILVSIIDFRLAKF